MCQVYRKTIRTISIEKTDNALSVRIDCVTYLIILYSIYNEESEAYSDTEDVEEIYLCFSKV